MTIAKKTGGVRIGLILAGLAYSTTAVAGDPSQAAEKSSRNSGGAFRVTAGVDYSSGKYGDITKTRVVSAPIGLKYSNGPVTVRVSVPFVHVDGPASLLTTPEGRGGRSGGGSNSGSGSSGTSGGGGGGGGSGNSGSGSSGSGSGSSNGSGNIQGGGADRKVSGIGDVNVSLTYSFDLGDDAYFDVTGKVKLPSASRAKRLGTGKTDFVAAAELSKVFGKVDVYAGGYRRFAGSRVANPVRDSWGASTGLGVKPSEGLRLGIDYDWQEAAFIGGRSSSEITGSANVRLSSDTNLNLYASTGLNAASSDIGAGLQISYRF
jgi:hypothetical protein